MKSPSRDVAPDQYGASAHRVGRRVMAAAHVGSSTMEWAFRYGRSPLCSER